MNAGNLRLDIGSHIIPHPDKVHKGGEDALFVSHCKSVFGELSCSVVFLSPLARTPPPLPSLPLFASLTHL